MKFTFVYIISLWLSFSASAQQVADSTGVADHKEQYGLRMGVDISRPVIQWIRGSGMSYEVDLDYPLGDKASALLCIGGESVFHNTERFDYQTSGTYFTLGYDRNIYDNFPGYHHEVSIGLHYGFAVFGHHLSRYIIGNHSDYFGSTEVHPNRDYSNLQAHWIGLRFGVRAELFPRFFLGTGVRLNKLIYAVQPENFDNFYIPGFRKVLPSQGAVYFYYTVSYSFPIKF